MGDFGYGWSDSDDAGEVSFAMALDLVEKGQKGLDRCLAGDPDFIPEEFHKEVRPYVMLLHELVTKTRLEDGVAMETYFRAAQVAMREHLFGDYANDWGDPEAYRQAVAEDIETLQSWLDRRQNPTYGQHEWAVALMEAGAPLPSLHWHERTPATHPSITAVAEMIPDAVTVVRLREDLATEKVSALFGAETLPKRVGYPVGAVCLAQEWVLVIPAALKSVRERLLPDGPPYPVRTLSPFRAAGDNDTDYDIDD